MIPGNRTNNTCGAYRYDPRGDDHPRDIRLQIYISLTLGVGAFLTFCASLHITRHGATALIEPYSISVHGGRAYTLRARSRTTSRLPSPSFQIASSAGSFRYGRSQTNRCWRLRAWMPTCTSSSHSSSPWLSSSRCTIHIRRSRSCLYPTMKATSE
jgi:hypothetical protein